MVQPELRRTFHDQLASVQERVLAMTRMVEQGLESVTETLLAGDRVRAELVIANDAPLDGLYAQIEAEIQDLIARQAPVARDLRFVLAALRIAQEVERCGDLVASIARRADRIDPAVLTPDIRSIVYEMGAEATGMFRSAARAFEVCDPGAAMRLEEWDDTMDDLHRRLLATVFALRDASVESAVELGLVARFYERIADHAVVIAERVRFIASGAMNAGDTDESSEDDQ